MKLFLRILFFNPISRLVIFSLAILASLASFCVPYFQKRFIDLFATEHSLIVTQLIYFLFLVTFFSLFAQILSLINKNISYKQADIVQHWLSAETYTKTLSLASRTALRTSLGKIVSIYASDISTAATLIDEVIPNSLSYLIPILFAPLAIIFMTEIKTAPIFILILCILALNFSMVLLQTYFFYNNKKYAAERIEFVHEWLQNMRAFRVLGWNHFFEKKIRAKRELETLNRLKQVTNGTSMASFSYSAPFFINIFATYILVKKFGTHLTPGQILSTLWVFAVILTRPMRALPMMLLNTLDCYTSIKRIEKYWQNPAEPEALVSENRGDSFENIASRFKSGESVQSSNAIIQIKNLIVEIEGKKILDSISVEIKKNEFIAIVGELGSGKTSFVQALLGFMPASFDEYKLNGRQANAMSLQELRSHYSYVPQDFFVMNSSLRNNVVFDYNADRNDDLHVLQTLALAQFSPEKEGVLQGLDSEIGERGVNLSGGQKQRVLLARALWADRPIVLLDDSLSALDAKTEKNIIESLFTDAWKDKTRILITHRLSVLDRCDRVLYMKNGRLSHHKI